MRPLFLLLLLAAAARAAEPDPFTAPLAASHPLYLDARAPLDRRVDDLLGRLTLEEKATALDHHGPDLDRIGLRSDKWNQCLNGVQWDRPTTLFPVCIAMGATWDPALVHDIASALSDEARAIYNAWKRDPALPAQHKGLIYRAPVINISRNPYWGRIHEVYSEDPVLTGAMAVAYVRGLQGDDPRHLKIAATLKHFAVNNVESGRTHLNAAVPERWLREYWLPHWRAAVTAGGACSLMASYNAINGTPNNINHWLLTDLLKNEWRHDGFVVSDLGGVKTMVTGHEQNRITYEDAVARSLAAGCDFSDKEFRENIPAAVRDGKLAAERLDDAVRRVLRVRFRLGEFDPQESLPWHNLDLSTVDSPAHRQLALRTAEQAIVLLKNERDFLPLDPAKLKRIAVIGPCANLIQKNNYNGKSTGEITALAGLQAALPHAQVAFEPGAFITAPKVPSDPAPALARAIAAARDADVVLLFVGTDASVEQEGRDRKSLGLPGNQEQLAEAVLAANPHTVVIQMSAGPLAAPYVAAHAPAILQAWWPGGQGGAAIANILLGVVNPCGHLPYTVYASDAQVPPVDQYDISKGFTYMFVKGAPLWPFGHGLSYSAFKYSNLRVSTSGSSVQASLDLTNVSARDGREVVQLYVSFPASSVTRPVRKLCAFAKIDLPAGGTIPVHFQFPADTLAYWSEKEHRFVIEPEKYEAQAGASSADIRLESAFTLDK